MKLSSSIIVKYNLCMLVFMGVASTNMSVAAAEQAVANNIQNNDPALEISSLCQDGAGKLEDVAHHRSTGYHEDPVEEYYVAGRHSRAFRFPRCYAWHEEYAAATVYQMHGTGDIWQARVLFGPQKELNYVTVLEQGSGSCTENDPENTDNDGDGVLEEQDWWWSCVEGDTRNGVFRWRSQPSSSYTVIVHGHSVDHRPDFAVQVAVVAEDDNKKDICSDTGAAENLGSVSSIRTVVDWIDMENFVRMDLPTCHHNDENNNMPLIGAPSKLYHLTVDEARVRVTAVVEQGESSTSLQVYVRNGSCGDEHSGYRCLDMGEVNPSFPSTLARSSTYAAPQQAWHNANAGTEYLLEVGSTSPSTTWSTDFRLTVNVSPYGDICRDAATVNLSSSVPTIISLHTSIKAPYHQALFTCHHYFDFDHDYFESGRALDGNIALFTFVATGDGVLASIGPVAIVFPNLHMTLYEATTDGCDSELMCVAVSSASKVLLVDSTKSGVTYYLAVHADAGEESGLFMEGAELIVETIPTETPCETAMAIEVGSGVTTLEGSTLREGVFRETQLCFKHVSLSRAKVFSFTAQTDGPVIGKVKAIETEEDGHEAYPFYPFISVSTGTCGIGDCPAAYASIFPSSGGRGATWSVTAGETNFVAIFGDDFRRVGDFHLTLESLSTTTLCDSQDVKNLGTLQGKRLRIDGTTRTSPHYSDLYKCDGEWRHYSESSGESVDDEENIFLLQEEAVINSRASVYTFNGDGNTYTISLDELGGFRANLNVYAGQCDNLRCVGKMPDPQYSFQQYFTSERVNTVEGVVYTIVVGDCCGFEDVGSFKLTIQQVKIGDLQRDAVSLDGPFDGEIRLVGDTDEGLLFSDLPECYNTVETPATIYKIDAGSGIFSASILGFGFDAKLAAFTSSLDGRDEYECIGVHSRGTDSWSGSSGPVYLVVHGCCDTAMTGDYVLRVKEMETSSVDVCDSVRSLGVVPEHGLLMEVGSIDADSDVENKYLEGGAYPACSNDGDQRFEHRLDSLAVAYTVQGKGQLIRASLYTESYLGRDVSLTVMKGDCEALECITDPLTTGSSSSQSVVFPSIEEQTYHIIVETCCGRGASTDFLVLVETAVEEHAWIETPGESGSEDTTGEPGNEDATDPPAFEEPPTQASSAVSCRQAVSLSVFFICWMFLVWGQ